MRKNADLPKPTVSRQSPRKTEMRSIALFLTCSVSIALFTHDNADASEWGCEVLLCAASSNPSWHSIASCRPPMERLISAMKRPGFSWPTCPEGGAGRPGFELYADCPSGWTPTQGEDIGSRSGQGQLPQCRRIVGGCGRGWQGGGSAPIERANGVRRVYSGDHSCSYTEFMDRPLRDDPYYFDIRDDATNGKSRHFFNLRK